MGQVAARIDTGFIDGLRAISSVWVVIAHCMIWGGYHGFIPDPKIAVDIFIIISGYLITLTYKEGSHPFPFYVRRAFRLLPLYYLVLIVSFSCFDAYAAGYASLQSLDPGRWVGSVHDPLHYVADTRSFLVHLSMLFGLSPMYSIGSMLPDWSLSLEWQFYLCFPLLVPIIVRRPVLSTIVATGLSWFWVTATRPMPFHPSLFGVVLPEPSALPIKLPIFLVGILGYLYHRSPEKKHLKWIAIALIVGQTAFAAKFLYGYQSLAFLALASVFLADNRLIGVAFGSRIFKFFADTSYSAYLTHGFFIAFVGSWLLTQFGTGSDSLNLMLMAPAVLVCTYAMSAVLYVAIERPMTHLGKRLARHPIVMWRPRFAA